MKPVHTLDIFGTKIFIATSKKQWKRLVKHFEDLDITDKDNLGMTCFIPSRNALVFWINTKDETELGLVNTCAHEASHAASRILEQAGHEVLPGDEPFAYLTGFLTELLWRTVSKR